MRQPWMMAYAVCLVLGIALWKLAPVRWNLEPAQAAMIGTSIYFAALHRWILRAQAKPGGRSGAVLLRGALLRGAFFLALVGIEGYLCFEAWPRLDLRAGFVLSSAWLVALAVIDPPRVPAVGA
jgi:hypothetical protein